MSPKFKVGDTVRSQNLNDYIIINIREKDNYYEMNGLFISSKDFFSLDFNIDHVDRNWKLLTTILRDTLEP